MKKQGNRVLYIAPRMLGILSILFISLFSLDVIQSGLPLINILIGLGIHLMPSVILLLILLVAWKHELVGGLLFIAVSIIPFILLSNPFWVNVILTGPFCLTGMLFIVQYFVAKRSIMK